MSVHFFKFDGNVHMANDSGFQNLLTELGEAITTEAWSDPSLSTDEERQEAESQSWDATSHDADMWSNLQGLMMACPYTLEIERVELTTAVAVEMYHDCNMVTEDDAERLSERKALMIKMVDWALPEGDPMRDLSLLDLAGFESGQGDEVLDAIVRVLDSRLY